MAGRYKILESLAAGGVGEVYKAFDTQLSRYVAIKRLLSREESEKSDGSSSTLKKEAASLATLQHPNIVSVYDLSSDDSGMFIVMELLEGDTLADWLQRETMNLTDFKEFATQTLEGILSAHQVNILHRDLKPENIKMNRLPGGRLQAKIVDFGLARMSYAARKQTEDQSGNVLGSIYYMAPEQLLRKSLDGRTDLYSLGCVFYQCLAGRRPFDGELMRDVMDSHLHHRVRNLQEVAPHVPAPICEWVMWMINQEQAHRPANARAALDHLRALADAGWFAVAAAVPAQPAPGPPAASAPQPTTGQLTAPLSRPPSGAVRPPSGAVRPPTGAVRPTSGAVRPVTGSQPAPRATVATQRPTSAIGRPPGTTTGVLQAHPVPAAQEPVAYAIPVKEDAPARAGVPVWIYALVGIAVVGGAAFFVLGGKKRPGVSPLAQQSPPAADRIADQPKGFLAPGVLAHYRVGEKTDAWGDDGKPHGAAKPGDRVLSVQDLEGEASSVPFTAMDRKKELCPTFALESIKEFRVPVGLLHFTTAQGIVARVDSGKPEAKKYPFGADAKVKGLTLIALVRPEIKDTEVRCIQLRNPATGAFLEVRAFPNNEWRVKARTKDDKGKEITKEGKVTGRDTKKFNLLGLTWDTTTKKIVMAVRSHDGGKSRAECDAPPNCPPLLDLQIGEKGATKANQFSGDFVELMLWPYPMDSEKRTEQEMKLTEFYFKEPGKRW